MPATKTGTPLPEQPGYTVWIEEPDGEIRVLTERDVKVSHATVSQRPAWWVWASLALAVFAVVFLGFIAWDVHAARADQRELIYSHALLRRDFQSVLEEVRDAK